MLKFKYKKAYCAIKILFMQYFFSIDATQETGRFGRLVNHSCKAPNCVPKVEIYKNRAVHFLGKLYFHLDVRSVCTERDFFCTWLYSIVGGNN